MKITSKHIKIAALQHAINTLEHGDYDTDAHPVQMHDKIMDQVDSGNSDAVLEHHNKYQPKLDDEYEKIIEFLQNKLDRLEASL